MRREDVVAHLATTRPDHWFKNVFVLPGAAFALALVDAPSSAWLPRLLVALVAACLAASANYAINELLDAETDRHHPEKSARPGAAGRLRPAWTWTMHVALAVTSLVLASFLGAQALAATGLFLLMGLVYNVPPVRTKERAYLDVVSESINNPIRFVLGWAAVAPLASPPSSILVAYWTGGAFLMAVKRLAEYRRIGDPEVAARYRRSFARYTETSLLLSACFHALASTFLLGVFLVKHRVEYLLAFPIVATLFTWYLAIGLRPDSPTQRPEALWREGAFVVFLAFATIAMTALLFIDLPALEWLLEVRQ